RNRNPEPTADDLKKESRNFWIFTAVVALLVAAAILFILWRRGIIFSDPTETPAPSTTAAVSTEESTTLPVTSTEEPTTEEVTTEEPTTEEVTTEEPTEDPAEEVVLHYSNIFVVKADEANSLYVRDAGSPEGKVIGILYGFSGGEILGEEGDWYHVSSGSVTGYVSKNFVQTGDAAKELAKAHTALHAKVTADTLNVRSAPDTSDDGNIINTVLKGASLPYLATEGNFYKITDPNGNVGYVSTAFSDLGYYLDEAVPYTQP
ncbi:MAG: SH3 domain-containing protein, partial [Lachnospiraceae bacterium]|nr:SH3 domain-containing protein [Lachnospiraceae bacterium]